MSVQEMMPIALSTMMAVSGDMSYIKDRDLRYVCCSESLAKALGLESPRDVIGKRSQDFFSGNRGEEIAERDRQVVETGEPILNFTERFSSGGGAGIVTITSKYPITDAYGNVIGLYGVSRDITAERERESQLELLTNSIPGGLATYAIAEGGLKVLYFNDGFFRYTGYTRDEYTRLTKEDPLAIVFEEDKQALRDLIGSFGRHKTDGLASSCVYRCKTKDGGFRWMNMKSVLSKVGENRFIVNIVQFDMTEQQEEKERLRISEEFNRLALEQSGNIITRFDVNSRQLTLPDAFNPIFVLPHVLYNMPEEQIALGRVSLDTADAYRELFESIVRGVPSGRATYKQNSSKGWRFLEAQFTTVFSNDGKPVSAVISFTDVTEKLEKEVVYNKWQQSLEERSEDSYTLFRCNLSKDNSFDSREGKLLGVIFDEEPTAFDDKTREYIAQFVCDEDKERYAEFLNSNTMLAEYYCGHRSDSIEYREKTASGTRWIRLTVDLVEYPTSKDIEAYLMYENIDEQKKAELLTIARSQTDPLTGILNRSTFIAEMEKVLARSRSGDKHALMMLDIDNFKSVNDTLGHGVGDKVLIDLTKKIGAILRRGDLLGRMGGDEFFVFLKNVGDEECAADKAKRICGLEISVQGSDIPVTISMGVAMIPDDGKDFDTLYKKVDSALYRQKAHGKNGFRFVEKCEKE